MGHGPWSMAERRDEKSDSVPPEGCAVHVRPSRRPVLNCRLRPSACACGGATYSAGRSRAGAASHTAAAQRRAAVAVSGEGPEYTSMGLRGLATEHRAFTLYGSLVEQDMESYGLPHLRPDVDKVERGTRDISISILQVVHLPPTPRCLAFSQLSMSAESHCLNQTLPYVGQDDSWGFAHAKDAKQRRRRPRPPIRASVRAIKNGSSALAPPFLIL